MNLYEKLRSIMFSTSPTGMPAPLDRVRDSFRELSFRGNELPTRLLMQLDQAYADRNPSGPFRFALQGAIASASDSATERGVADNLDGYLDVALHFAKRCKAEGFDQRNSDFKEGIARFDWSSAEIAVNYIHEKIGAPRTKEKCQELLTILQSLLTIEIR